MLATKIYKNVQVVLIDGSYNMLSGNLGIPKEGRVRVPLYSKFDPPSKSVKFDFCLFLFFYSNTIFTKIKR